MENVSKALIIAGAILLSLMIVSLLVYTGKSFGIIAKAEQDAKLTEDKAKFNKEYEVFDKNLMYGTDVLSCLNKAQSNNQKYVHNNYYGTENLGSEYRTEYLINVEVKLLESVQETITVYKLNNSGKRVQLTTGEEAKPTVKMFSNDTFKIPSIYWYYFTNDGQVKKTEPNSYATALWKNANTAKAYNLKTTTINTHLTPGTYNLLTSTGTGDVGKLSALLSTASEVEKTIVNKKFDEQVLAANGTYDVWYSAIWRTAAYDFKTKKFKCTGIEYNSETGYVSKISFEEVLPYN